MTAVLPDHFDVLDRDGLLTAELTGAVAVCLYDAVEETGGLVHLRLLPPRQGTGDEPLGDFLLFEACMARLKDVSRESRHWQARALAHLGADGSLNRVAESVVQSLTQYCADSRIRFVGCEQRMGLSVVLQFRPSMGQYRVV
jgi:hypothetical protein